MVGPQTSTQWNANVEVSELGKVMGVDLSLCDDSVARNLEPTLLRWHFLPHVVDGRKTAVSTTVPIRFDNGVYQPLYSEPVAQPEPESNGSFLPEAPSIAFQSIAMRNDTGMRQKQQIEAGVGGVLITAAVVSIVAATAATASPGGTKSGGGIGPEGPRGQEALALRRLILRDSPWHR